MNSGRVSKTDIENDFVKIFEKYPNSIEKAIRVLEQAKKSIRGGKYTPKPAKARKTRKKTSK